MLKLGCYPKPSINVGPAMMSKILSENGQVLHRSMCRLLIPDQLSDKDGTDAKEQFMARVYKWLGSQVLPRELEGIRLKNTQCDPYEDVTQNKQTFSQLAEELEPMPDRGDH